MARSNRPEFRTKHLLFHTVIISPNRFSKGSGFPTYTADILISAIHTNWQQGTQHGTDFWTRAERFIAKRRSREIDRAWMRWIGY
jgi:hypothetical protein